MAFPWNRWLACSFFLDRSATRVNGKLKIEEPPPGKTITKLYTTDMSSAKLNFDGIHCEVDLDRDPVIDAQGKTANRLFEIVLHGWMDSDKANGCLFGRFSLTPTIGWILSGDDGGWMSSSR